MDSKWMAVHNCFDPFVPVSGDKINAWFVKREDDPLERLEHSFAYDRPTAKILLFGQRGSGKTSELFKLISKLQDRYFTVYIDAYASLELDETSRAELLFFLGAGIYSVAKNSGLKVDDGLWKALVSSLSTLTRDEQRQKDISIDLTGPLRSIAATAGTIYPTLAVVGTAMDGFRFSLGLTKSDIEHLEIGPSIQEILQRVNAIIASIEKCTGKSVLLIADGLDRITSSEYARSLFAKSRYLTGLRCNAIFTVPVALYSDAAFRGSDNDFDEAQFPNIRIYEKNNRQQLYKSGYAKLHEVIRKRLDSLGLSLETVFASDALDYLISMSGGVMRDLVQLVRRAAMIAENNGSIITLENVKEVVHTMQNEWALALRKEDYAALQEILQTGIIARSDPIQTLLLWGHYVIYYQNGGVWCDIHPLILPAVEEHFSSISKNNNRTP